MSRNAPVLAPVLCCLGHHDLLHHGPSSPALRPGRLCPSLHHALSRPCLGPASRCFCLRRGHHPGRLYPVRPGPP